MSERFQSYQMPRIQLDETGLSYIKLSKEMVHANFDRGQPYYYRKPFYSNDSGATVSVERKASHGRTYPFLNL